MAVPKPVQIVGKQFCPKIPDGTKNSGKQGASSSILKSFCIPKQKEGKFCQANITNAHSDIRTVAHKPQHQKNRSYSQFYQRTSGMHSLCLRCIAKS